MGIIYLLYNYVYDNSKPKKHKAIKEIYKMLGVFYIIKAFILFRVLRNESHHANSIAAVSAVPAVSAVLNNV